MPHDFTRLGDPLFRRGQADYWWSIHHCKYALHVSNHIGIFCTVNWVSLPCRCRSTMTIRDPYFAFDILTHPRLETHVCLSLLMVDRLFDVESLCELICSNRLLMYMKSGEFFKEVPIISYEKSRFKLSAVKWRPFLFLLPCFYQVLCV